jgi:hypothetical protein
LHHSPGGEVFRGDQLQAADLQRRQNTRRAERARLTQPPAVQCADAAGKGQKQCTREERLGAGLWPSMPPTPPTWRPFSFLMMLAISGSTSDRGPSYCSNSFLSAPARPGSKEAAAANQVETAAAVGLLLLLLCCCRDHKPSCRLRTLRGSHGSCDNAVATNGAAGSGLAASLHAVGGLMVQLHFVCAGCLREQGRRE